jgi:hypothetical protein
MIPNPNGTTTTAELAQSVERTTLNRVVVGSIPTFGVLFVSIFYDPAVTYLFALAYRHFCFQSL